MLCACDSRYATESAFFSIKETQLGMTADVGTLQRLPHLMPHGLVKELAFTGRTMSATEALSFGFINRIFSDYEQMIEGVMQIASMIAANSPLAVTGCKQMLNYARDHSVKDSLEYMATWQSGMFQMPDVMAAMHADKAKTVAEFEELHGKHAQMK